MYKKNNKSQKKESMKYRHSFSTLLRKREKSVFKIYCRFYFQFSLPVFSKIAIDFRLLMLLK
jgi:hypothetical protein